MTITLTPDVAAALAEKAKQQGTTPEALANEYLQKQVLPSAPARADGQTLADALKDYIGAWDSSKATPGPQKQDRFSREFAEHLEEKKRQGRL